MSNRKYLSGSEKRKLKKQKEESLKKLPAVTNYFKPCETKQDQIAEAGTEQDQSRVVNNPDIVDNNDSNTVNSENGLDKDSTQISRDLNVKNTLVTEQNLKKNSRANDSANNILNSGECVIISNSINLATVNDIDLEIHKDPALWPLNLCENSYEREKYLQKGHSFFQNKNSTFATSKRQYNKQNRYFSQNYYQRILPNGEKCERKWLMFSESTGSIFCFVCKLFSKDRDNSFVKQGFSNWKKIDEIICSHDNNKEHNRCMMEYIDYLSNSNIVASITREMENEVKYWIKVLKRVVAGVRFLTERGLPLRGKNEVIGSPNNGNFLGIMELLSQFDPFLEEHIKTYANKGRGNVSYLSKTIYEEFIHLMAKKVTTHIRDEIKEAKYWGLVVDSTPDISHADQLSVVFRYYLNGHVHERFFCFFQITSHKGRSLSNEVLELLSENDIKIENCPAQTYDNAANMSGKYSAMQACIREQNEVAYYVPCVGHSLNLVGECSVDECLSAINFFNILQKLYAFFSASTHRWNVLLTENSTLTSLSKTRWSCRADATRLLVKNFNGIYNALKILTEDKDQKSDTRTEAAALLKHIIKLENVFMALLWDRILNRFNTTSQYLQKIDVDLISASHMLLSLVDFVKDLRDEFSNIENQARQVSTHVNQEYSNVDKRKITRKLANKETQTCSLTTADKFRINEFYVIIDKLVTELQSRSKAYNHIVELFGFLCQLLFIQPTELELKVKNLIQVYSNDLEDGLLVELQQFIPRLKMQPVGFFSNRSDDTIKEIDKNLCPLKVLNWIVELDMIQVFPNIYIAYRLLLTIPIANCESERSFSVLKRIKNVLRSTMLDDRLSALATLNIEVELLRSLDFDDLIHDFAKAKSRKKYCY